MLSEGMERLLHGLGTANANFRKICIAGMQGRISGIPRRIPYVEKKGG